MKLKDHRKIGQVVLNVRDDILEVCTDLASMAIDASTEFDREIFTVRFKAYYLILSALDNLINEYDFDLTYEGDYEDE